MKYSIQFIADQSFTAGTKAVRDVNRILSSNGYTPLVYRVVNGGKIKNLVTLSYFFYFILFKLKNEDVCFLQWPYYGHCSRLFSYLAQSRCKHLIVLIHDLNGLRELKTLSFENEILRKAETVIAHTSQMKSYLVSIGVEKTKVKVLTTFDYLLRDNGLNIPNRIFSSNIVFAGNLYKSTFLERFNLNTPDIRILCYGKTREFDNNALKYMGSFVADEVHEIKGSWGLVWDGDSTTTCSGSFGNYLKYISPHKVSLYIVSRLPIIIWKESALANYVREKEIGLLIGSLDDIPSVLSNVNKERYQSFLVNIDKERLELINGKHLSRLL